MKLLEHWLTMLSKEQCLSLGRDGLGPPVSYCTCSFHAYRERLDLGLFTSHCSPHDDRLLTRLEQMHGKAVPPCPVRCWFHYLGSHWVVAV